MKRYFKGLFILIVFVFLFSNVFLSKDSILEYWSSFKLLPFLFSFLIMLLIYPEGAFNFYSLLKAFTKNISFKKSFYIFIVANTSRYIPGSVWQYLGRVEIAKRVAGVERKKTLLVLLFEVFLLMVSSVFVGSFALLFLRSNQVNLSNWIFLSPLMLIFLHPLLANKILIFLIRISGKKIKLEREMDFKKILLSFPFFVVNFLLNGIALFFLVASITGDYNPVNILAFTSFYALSWFLGYIALIAPAGLGVVETSLAFLLSQMMPFPVATTVAVAYRIFLTIAELIVFAVTVKLGHEDN